MSEREGKTVRLPTEAEWEYACRAGTNEKWFFGQDESLLADYAWCKQNSGGVTHPVGTKKPNPWGLYDMYGNVWEWTLDRYAQNYEQTPRDGTHHKIQSDKGMSLRGGAWSAEPMNCRSARRINLGANSRNYFVGFRVVVEV
jgi:formylglycine-generating enzyme required for sulfatase activity